MNSAVDTVVRHLRNQIGEQPVGTRLPSVRSVVALLHVSPVTVQKALARLAGQGIVETRPGQGIFVAAANRRRDAQAPAADMAWQALALGPRRVAPDPLGSVLGIAHDVPAAQLGNGYLPEALQATQLLAAAASRALRQPGVWSRLPPEGAESLRAWFTRATDGAFRADEVTIVPGTQSALGAAFRALTTANDPILMESPTYTGAIAAARALGLQLIPIPTDRHGVRCDFLEDAFRSTGARVFYSQPTFANPTGASLAPERRREVLDILARQNAFMIEDDWARDLCLEGEPPLPLACEDREGHVIYLRSLTKCAAPGLRVGAVCARGPALERLRATRAVDDFFVPGLLQATAIELVTNPAWPRHLRRLHAALRDRRDALAEALGRHLGPSCLPVVPSGGLHLWVKLPHGVVDQHLAQRAASQGIAISAGVQWFPAEPSGPFLRLSFASVQPDAYDEIIGRLSSLMNAS
jgi:DNA-binding transcriptional MocR family regulator